MNYLSTDLFTYNKETKTFTAELSELMRHPSLTTNIHQPFYLKSARTGEVRLFLQDHTDYNGKEVAGWHYICPGEGFSVLIIND